MRVEQKWVLNELVARSGCPNELLFEFKNKFKYKWHEFLFILKIFNIIKAWSILPPNYCFDFEIKIQSGPPLINIQKLIKHMAIWLLE